MKTPAPTPLATPEFETLSSSTLFHFTKSFDVLKLILENGFIPRYSPEDLSQLGFSAPKVGVQYTTGIPMVCFCDIPLSKIKNHLSWYGGYGIGMDKKWGIRAGISPILYYDSSETTRSLKTAIEHVYANLDEAGMWAQTLKPLHRLASFAKRYEGYFEHSGKVDTQKRFYDEREWRYVPLLDEATKDSPPSFLPYDDEFDDLRKKHNDKIASMSALHLSIIPEHVRYIIVQDVEVILPNGAKSTEILELMKFIDQIFGGIYPMNAIQTLKTKIITTRQIKEDF